MPTACLNQTHCRVHLTGERLEIRVPNTQTGCEELLREIPLRDLDRLICDETAHFTPAALTAVLQRGIPIQFFAWNGQFLGNFLPAQNHHGLARMHQYERTREPDYVLNLSGRIITAKIYNQRRVLQRLAASRDAAVSDGELQTNRPDAQAMPTGLKDRNPKNEMDQTLAWLDALFAPVKNSRGLEELRGYEGAAAARYFQTWATFLPAAFPFERRSTRPPLNPVNACISFAATILYNEAIAFLHAHGLDPALGLLHATEDGRWSLALDLIEPFRPVLVEALALDLFSHEILNVGHFESRNGGVYLNDSGRRKFFLQYERRMERQFMSECVGHRTTLRLQLENQAVLFKAALKDPGQFEPFLMN